MLYAVKSMKSVTTYLTFNGACRPAMTFYAECLGGELELVAVPDEHGQPSQDPAARIMHSRVVKNGTPLVMGSDIQAGSKFHLGNNFSVTVDCDDVAEIDHLFAALVVGGKVIQPLGDAPWGARFGMLIDQFSTQWMLNCDLRK